MTRISLNLKDIASNNEYSTISPGCYTAIVSNCESKTSQAGNPYLSIEFTILEQPHTNRKLFEHFVLNQEIALRRLKSMAIAGRHPNPDYIADASEFVGLKLIAKVIVREDDDFGRQNKIVSFRPIPSEKPPQAPPNITSAVQLDLPI